MKFVKLLLLLSIILFLEDSSYGGDDIKDTIEKVTSDLGNVDLKQKTALELQGSEMEEDELVKQLFTLLMETESAETKAAVTGVLIWFEPFPFSELKVIHENSKNSRERASSLTLLNKGVGTEDDIEALKAIAGKCIFDGSPGIKLSGEAASYGGTEGKRVKELAYNILVQRNKLNDVLPRLISYKLKFDLPSQIFRSPSDSCILVFISEN